MKKLIERAIRSFGYEIRKCRDNTQKLNEQYLINDRVPWSAGYIEYKQKYISKLLSDDSLLSAFQNKGDLPANHGIGLDERCIEYPWYLSHSNNQASNILDAGSALNHEFIINSEFISDKKLTILTLAPEANCFWRSGVSYQYSDLQNMPFRDELFDEVACISTLEHVGMDNEIYTKAKSSVHDKQAFEHAVLEMKRVLKSQGRLFITVPFGKYQDWGMFQQFDEQLLLRVVNIFEPATSTISIYAYTDTGWQRSSIDACRNSEFSEYAVAVWNGQAESIKPEPDRAAAARAVACMELVKGAQL